MKRVAVVVVSVVSIALMLSACSSSSKSAKKDVTITACTASPTGGHPTATGKIVNHSSKTSLYAIHVKFKDSSGNAVGDGVATVASVDANQTATWHATGTVNANGKVTCDLASVTRTVSV